MKKQFVTCMFTLLFNVLALADVPAIHGMLLFGNKQHYASHLPMFHHPHDYQLIMNIDLGDIPRSETLKNYEFLKASGESLFTLVPEKMDLSKVINGEKQSFQAVIYQGHFERGGKKLGPVEVEIENIIFSKKLNPKEIFRPKVEYIVFGENGEYYAAHLIKEKPSFDRILQVGQAFQMLFPHCRTRACGDPMEKPVQDDQLPLTIIEANELSGVGDFLGEMKSAFVEIQKVIYHEESDLQH